MNKRVELPDVAGPATLFDWAEVAAAAAGADTSKELAREVIQVRRAADGVTFVASHVLRQIQENWDNREQIDLKFGDADPVPLTDVLCDSNNPERLFELCQKIYASGQETEAGTGHAIKFDLPVIFITPHQFFRDVGHFQAPDAYHGDKRINVKIFPQEGYRPYMRENGHAQIMMLYGMSLGNPHGVNLTSPDFLDACCDLRFKVEVAHQLALPLSVYPRLAAQDYSPPAAHPALEVLF